MTSPILQAVGSIHARRSREGEGITEGNDPQEIGGVHVLPADRSPNTPMNSPRP